MTDKSLRFERLTERILLLRVPADGRISLADASLAQALQDSDDCWLVVVPEEASYSPKIGETIQAAIDNRPDVGLFYADEVEQTEGSEALPILKPSFDSTLLMAKDYIGFPLIIRSSVIAQVEGFKADCLSATAYDFVLRAFAAGIVIDRIPEILLAYRGKRIRSDVVDRHSVLIRWLSNNAPHLDAHRGLTNDSFQIARRAFDCPVTLVIPMRQGLQATSNGRSHKLHVTNLLNSLEKTDWPPAAVRIIIDDDIGDDEVYARGRWRFQIDRLQTKSSPDTKINYAAKMNELWREAETEHLVFLSGAVAAENAGWLKALLTFATKDEVGGVGARLLYPNGNIQHAGIIGSFDAFAHAWLDHPAGEPTYEDWASVHREWSMVTGAVFATRKSIMQEIGGFDERLAFEHSDADLCLRLRLLGYKIVYTPFANFLNFDEPNRKKYAQDGPTVARFLRKWGEYLRNDPFSHSEIDKYNSVVTPIQHIDPWYKNAARPTQS